MKRMRVATGLLTAVSALLALSSCKTLPSGPGSSLNTYQNDHHLVRFRYPHHLRVEETERPGKQLSVTLTEQSRAVANLTTYTPGMANTFLSKADASSYQPFTLGGAHGAAFLTADKSSYGVSGASAMAVVEHNQKLYIIKGQPSYFSQLTKSFSFLSPSQPARN